MKRFKCFSVKIFPPIHACQKPIFPPDGQCYFLSSLPKIFYMDTKTISYFFLKSLHAIHNISYFGSFPKKQQFFNIAPRKKKFPYIYVLQMYISIPLHGYAKMLTSLLTVNLF